MYIYDRLIAVTKIEYLIAKNTKNTQVYIITHLYDHFCKVLNNYNNEHY